MAGLKHSDYLEQVVQALMRRGMDKGKATAIARSSIRKWMAKSKHPEVRAAAGVAEAQEIAAQARAHAHAATWGELADVIDLAWIAHPTAAQYAVIDARTGHPWWKDGDGGKAKAPAKVTASALVTHKDGTVTGGAGKVKVGALAHENGKWVAHHGDGTTTKHAVRGVALKALAAHHNARAVQPAPASHTPAAAPPKPPVSPVAPAAVTPEAAAKPPAKITAASLVVHQDGSVAHKQSGAKVGTLSHENGKWAARHSDGTVSKHATRQVALQAIAARHNKAAVATAAPAAPKDAEPKAAPKAVAGILTGSHPADKMTVASDKQAAARSLSDDDLKRADTELARRAAMLGKPGQMSKGHEAVAAEMKRRAAGKVTAPAKVPAPAAAKAPADKAAGKISRKITAAAGAFADPETQQKAMAEAQHALDYQSALIPHTAGTMKITYKEMRGQVMGLSGGEFSPKISDAATHGLASEDAAKYRDSGWWVHADHHHTMTDTTIAHETGHRLLPAKIGYSMDLWTGLAKAIGLPPPKQGWPGGNAKYRDFADADSWIKDNQSAVEAAVSKYGASNSSELQAELWSEYSMSSSPRPAAKFYGDYALAALGEKA